MMLGLNLYGEGKRAKVLPIVNGIIAGLVVTVVNGVLNYSKYAEHYRESGIGYFIAVLAVTFVSAAASTSIVLWFIYYLNKKKQAQIQKRLDEEEQAE